MPRPPVLLAALALLLAAAPAAAQQRIVNGSPAAAGEFPYAAFLHIDIGQPPNYLECGGTLIAQRFVLTAAHCLGEQPINDQQSFAVIGATDALDAGSDQKWTFKTHLIDPDWNHQGKNESDVALIELTPNSVGFPAAAQARLLRPGDTGLWQPGFTATVVGWGATHDGPNPPTSERALQKVDIPLVSDSECANDFGPDATARLLDFTTMLCAGTADKDSCNGDSGGPVVVSEGVDRVLVGAVSFGVGPNPDQTCAEGPPGVYARVDADPLNTWIRQHVPQVEIDPSNPSPQPGDTVTFTAKPTDPLGSGPFGGYEHLAWDLDGDGQFTDAIDQPSVTKVMADGENSVAVRATDATTQDREVRKVNLLARFYSPVAFSAPSVTVTEGQPVSVTVVKPGQGSGSVTVLPAAGTATLGADVGASAPVTLSFAPGQGSQTVTFPTVDDTLVEPAETFTLTLTGFTGGLQPGSPGTVQVTILDNDGRPQPKLTFTAKSLTFRHGAAKLAVKTVGGGTLSASVKDAAGHVLAQALSLHPRSGGTTRLTLRLTPRGTKALRRRRSARATLKVALRPLGGGPSVTVRRPVTLRR